MSTITTHVLDTSRGKPAAGMHVHLEMAGDPGSDSWTELAVGVTNQDGRVGGFAPSIVLSQPGIFRLRFDTGAYFSALGILGFYPEVQIVVRIDDPTQHFHIPLLLSPFGYSTYRGS